MAKNTSTNFRNIANTFSETEKEETLETTPSVNPVETTEIPEPEPVQEDVEKKEESEPVVEKEPEKPVVEEKTEEEPVSLSKNDALDVTFLKGVSRQKRIVTVDRIMNIIKSQITQIGIYFNGTGVAVNFIKFFEKNYLGYGIPETLKRYTISKLKKVNKLSR